MTAFAHGQNTSPAEAAGNAADAPVLVAEEAEPAEAAPRGIVAWLEIRGPLREGPVPYAWVSEEEAGLSLQGVVDHIDRLAASDEHLGLVIYLDQPMLSTTQIDEITRTVHQAREAGLIVMFFAEAYDTASYLLACSGDRILLQNKGELTLSGIGWEEMYLAGLFEKIGIKADLIQVGKYKGADEQFTRTGPSEAWNENVSSLLDDMYGQIVGRISKARDMTVAETESAMADSWTMTDKQYVDRGLVDDLTERDLISVTGEVFGNQFAWEKLTTEPQQPTRRDNPFAVLQMLFQEKTTQAQRDSIALVHAYGPINSGDSSTPGGLFGGQSIGSRTMIRALRDARQQDKIKGVVIRTDSPGGSALASEVIWQAVREVGKVKPVFVSVGAMAASGGYYIACAGDHIYVSEASILGSIGVVGGKFVMGDLYEKVGVTIHRRPRGPFGDIFNSEEPFTPEQREAVRQSMESVYDQFIDRVTIGRGERLGDVDAVAMGRLFTGRQSIENGLADRIGGVDAALADMANKLGLEEGEYDIIDLPPPMNFSEFMSDFFAESPTPDGRAVLPALAAAREVLGPRRFEAVRRTLQGLMALRDESAVLIHPTPFVVEMGR